MGWLDTIELKPFVPALNFERSRRFYLDMGFSCDWHDDKLASFRHGNTAFLLQNYYLAIVAQNFMLHLLVENVDQWWQQLDDARITDIYGVRQSRIELRPWGMRDFTLTDPSGVLWRIAQHAGAGSSPGPG